MSNRKKIEKTCKDSGLEIIDLEYERDPEYAFGDVLSPGQWHLEIKKDNEDNEVFDSCGGIEILLNDIKDYAQRIEEGLSRQY